LIPPEKEKKDSKESKKKGKIGFMFNEKNSQKQGKVFCFKKFSKARKSILFRFDLQLHIKWMKGEI
jgi:uncharacterized membrane protein (UPF0127 family)